MKLDAIVLAAGQGKRMKSEHPKVLHRICGRTLLERVLRTLAALQPGKIVVVVGHREDRVRAELEQLKAQPFLFDVVVSAVRQENQAGTGDAAKTGLAALEDSSGAVLIVPGDSPLLEPQHLRPLLKNFDQSPVGLRFLSCRHPSPGAFGRVCRDGDGRVLKVVESKDCSEKQLEIDEINTSIYFSAQPFLREALGSLKNDNAQGEYYLTDIVEFAASKGAAAEAVLCSSIEGVSGANTRAELSELEAYRRGQINRYWMDEGVTLEDPSTTYIDEDVKIAPDVFVGAGSRLRGQCEIERDVFIEGQSLISGSRIGAGTRILLSCCIESTRIGQHCVIGPFAHLRPGTFLWDKVKVGNFVETKKAELHSGVKASHLSYIGDAEVKGGSNIGAGTITCNYDGDKKHFTRIGAGCFIGSNTSLIAPVSVGDGAYIGAGSTITVDVPPRSLGVARGRQRNVEGWADKKKSLREE